MVTTNTPTIRELMPDGFMSKIGAMIREEGGFAPANSNLSEVISQERITSKYWKYVERLALATDPEGYRARMEELRAARGLDSSEL